MVLEIPGGLFGQSDVRETSVAGEGISYWSFKGIAFTSFSPDIDNIAKNDEGIVTASENGKVFLLQVDLPHGAVVTNCIVHGNAAATAESWTLVRHPLDDVAGVNMAGANIGTADSSITSPTIDNANFGYLIFTTTLDTGDQIIGGSITYKI